MKTRTQGFSLLELLVTISIVAILTAIAVYGLRESQTKSRDAKRKADLRSVEAALALYHNKYGRYPSGCNASTTDWNATSWSGEQGTGHECASGNAYITGLAPEFLPELPRDPLAGRHSDGSGYVYTVNNEGSVYKFMSLNSVEAETVDQTHEFYRCDPKSMTLAAGGNSTSESWNDPGICWRSWGRATGGLNANRETIFSNTVCSDAAQYNNDYAVSAGFSGDARGRTGLTEPKGREFDTEIVRCR